MKHRDIIGALPPLCVAMLVCLLVGCDRREGGGGWFAPRMPALTCLAEAIPAGADATEDDVAVVAEGMNAFTLDLYRRLAAEGGNVVASPASVSLACGMAYAGARGETESQMAAALHYNLPQDRLHPAVRTLASRLVGGQESGGLRVANAMWLQSGYPLLPGFTEVVGRDYGAAAYAADFQTDPAGATRSINDWVRSATNDRIRDLIQPDLSRDTRLVLANAVHFLEAWEEPFERKMTEDGDFSTLDGRVVVAPMMHQREMHQYAETDDLQAVWLRYRYPTHRAMLVLPRPGRLEAVEAALTPHTLADLAAEAVWCDVDLTVPRFEFTAPSDLVQPLTDMGMVDAFDISRADFSGMTSAERLFISRALHKAYIRFDEKGTEAAAATAVAMEAAMAGDRVEFRADRPFLFLIEDEPVGVHLFIGRVADPTASGP